MLDRYPEDLPVPDLPSRMIDIVIRMGRAQNHLETLLDEEIFEDLSKHNTYWESKHEREDGILDDTRRSLSCLHDNLWDLMSILKNDTVE